MKISELVKGVLLFSMVVGVFSTAYIGTSLLYGGPNVSFSGPYDKIENLSSEINTLRGSTFDSASGGTATDDSETGFIRRVVTAVMLVPRSIGHAENLIGEVSKLMGVPPLVSNVLILVIVVGIIFVVWSAIMKWEL